MARRRDIIYRDKYPGYNNQTGFCVSNEDIKTHLELMKDEHLKEAACICSAGDVPLWVFLAKGVKVVAIDHSYISLGATMFRIEALKKLGARGFLGVIEEAKKARDPLYLLPPSGYSYNYGAGATKANPKHPLVKLVEEIVPTLPVELRTPGYGGLVNMLYNSVNSLYEFLPSVGEELMQKALDNLGKLTLIHGDLSDLPVGKCYDCLYLSNALEHQGRKGTITAEVVNKLSKQCGKILLTSASYGRPLTRLGEGWKVLQTKQVSGIGRTLTWNYSLLQRTPVA